MEIPQEDNYKKIKNHLQVLLNHLKKVINLLKKPDKIHLMKNNQAYFRLIKIKI
jgi:hypothetical protein